MVQADPQQSCTVKHFGVDEEHVFAQYSVTMAEDAFNALCEAQGEGVEQEPGKNKILVQALDVSGSMSGAPTTALKMGAKLIGQKFFSSDVRPFNRFQTILYNDQVRAFDAANLQDYEGRVDEIRAGGGTNFMNVFIHIEQLLQQMPHTEELVCIFITDGCDGYYNPRGGDRAADYNEVSERIKAIPNLRTKFLSIGFSRGHDAVFMNRIANFGHDIGNFIFIDQGEAGWQDNLQQSLVESLDIALESSAKAKFSIKNPSFEHEEMVKADIDYVERKEEVKLDPQSD